MDIDRDMLAIIAMWLAGFNTFQPINICRGGPEFLLKRFGFPSHAVGMFVGEAVVAANYYLFWGTMLALLITNFGRFIDTGWNDHITPTFSLISSLVVVLINFRLLHVYRTCEGSDGVKKTYYWISMAAMAYGFDMSVTWNVTPDKSPDWSVGENVANAYVSALHMITRVVLNSRCLRVDDVGYWLVFVHISAVAFISIATLGVWTAHVFVNVFLGQIMKSDFCDALEWLLTLKKSAENGSGECGKSDKWNSYLGCDGQSTQPCCCQADDCNQKENFVKYFKKLCGLNHALKALECTEDVSEQLNGTPTLSDSKYQLKGNMEKVQEPLEKLKGIANKLTTSDVSVCLTVQNGSTGSACCCKGKLSIHKQYTVTISDIKGTVKSCSGSETASSTIKLCACSKTTVEFKYCDTNCKTIVAVNVASGLLWLSSSDKTCAVSTLKCRFSHYIIDTAKLQSIRITGLIGTKEECNATHLRIDITLDFDPEEAQGSETCESAAKITKTVALKSTSCITIGGTVKTAGAAVCLRVGRYQACAGFRYSLRDGEQNKSLGLEFSLAHTVGTGTANADVEVVHWIMDISAAKSLAYKLTAKVEPVVVITDCTPTPSITNGNTAKVQKICLVDYDQKNHFRDLRGEMTKLFPKKKEQIRGKLKDDGVTQDISGASYCSTTKSITISSDKDKVCLYLVDGLKNAINALMDKNQSKVEAMEAFLKTKTAVVGEGYFASLVRGASPGFMVFFGLVFVFISYPGISPYLVVADHWLYFAGLLLLFASAIGPFIPWILCLKPIAKHVKYNRHWSGPSRFYHLTWLLGAPFPFVYCAFLLSLHYPGGICNRYIRHKWPAIVMGTLVHFNLFVLRPMGSGAIYPNTAATQTEKALSKAGKSTDDVFMYDIDARNGRDTFILMVSMGLGVVIFSILTGQSYAAKYRSYTAAAASGKMWPTYGFNPVKGLMWWTRKTLKSALGKFTKVPSTDIVKVILENG